jgi:hypothetical protein
LFQQAASAATAAANMKFSLSVAQVLLVGLAAAAPVELLERKTYGTTSNEYTTGGCKGVILFFARGSTQEGNLVRFPMPRFYPPKHCHFADLTMC